MTKRKWVGHKKILTWFWDRSVSDRILNKKLENDEELMRWCYENDCGVEKTWVQCPDEETYLMFRLRW
jgi:hypothetical protein